MRDTSWTATDETILREMVDRGYSNIQIAADFGVKRQRVQDKKRALGINAQGPDTVWRDCLVCFEVFASEGIHNRLCDPCRETCFWPYG